MHLEYSVFDAHCDTLDVLTEDAGADFPGHFTLTGAKQYKSYTQVMALFNDSSIHKNPYLRTCELIRKYYDIKKKYNFKTVLTKEDLTFEGVKTILGIEGGEAIGNDIDKVAEFYNLGVRIIGLTWNTPNLLCGTNTQSGRGTGLTKLGRAVAEKIDELSMVIDVSHMSEEGFYDIAERAKNPFIASHSNSKKICPHSRNLTDEQFKTLCRAGGVAGINFYPLFLGKDASVDTIICHIEHFMALGGEENIGIGSDFDGIDTLPRGIKNCGDIYLIFEKLLGLNYTEEQVKKIAYNNFYNLFHKILK